MVGGEVTSGAGSSGGSGLAVQGASAPESGVYQCHVANQHGVDISSTVLCVQGEFVWVSECVWVCVDLLL